MAPHGLILGENEATPSRKLLKHLPDLKTTINIKNTHNKKKKSRVGGMKRKKNLTKSQLDQINGIGRSRKRALLNYFGSAKAVESASFDDLKNVEGIESSVAKKIHDFFHD